VAVVVVAMVVVGMRYHARRYDALAPTEQRVALDHDDEEVPDFQLYFGETEMVSTKTATTKNKVV